MPALHEIPIMMNDGTQNTLADRFPGKAVLVVNVASKCGLTPQYAGLEELYREYAPRGLEILGVPSNQFNGQEPGSDPQIAEFCQLNYGVSFPLASKTDVKGPDAHPLFRALTDDNGRSTDVSWNFEKFLISPAGELVARFDPRTEPQASEIHQAINATLPVR